MNLRKISSLASLIFLSLFLVLPNALAQENELTIIQSIAVPTFDPHDHGTTAVSAVLLNIFDYLVMRDAEGVIQPSLASSWEQLDEKRWRFSLRDDVSWHDGEPFTAADVEFTIERVAKDDSLFEHDSFKQIEDIEVVSDFEFILHTTGPDPVLLNRLSRKGADIVPKHVIDEIGWEGFSVAPIGTGPYRMVEWIRDDRVILEAYEGHWRGQAPYERVVFRAVTEDATRVSEFTTGGAGIITNVPPQDIERIRANAGTDVVPQPTTRIMMMLLNTEEGKATADPLVREAIDYAIDNQLLIDAVLDGFGVPVKARVAPGVDAVPLKYYNDYAYDPERAKALLAEAGYGPGELTLTLQGPNGRYPKDAEQLEVIAVMLQEVGIETKVETLEWSAYLDRVWVADKVENIALIGLANSMFDGWFALRTLPCEGSYAGKTNWCNENFDELLTGAEFNLDAEARTTQIEQAFDIVVEERPMIALLQLQSLVGVADDISWQPRPDEMIWAFDIMPAN